MCRQDIDTALQGRGRGRCHWLTHRSGPGVPEAQSTWPVPEGEAGSHKAGVPGSASRPGTEQRRGAAATVTGGWVRGSSESSEVTTERPHPHALLGGDRRSPEARGQALNLLPAPKPCATMSPTGRQPEPFGTSHADQSGCVDPSVHPRTRRAGRGRSRVNHRAGLEKRTCLQGRVKDSPKFNTKMTRT